jgi:hypothetical protein
MVILIGLRMAAGSSMGLSVTRMETLRVLPISWSYRLTALASRA